ncbi:MAG: AtpZ/AtpI family protein [Gemmatimonadaceae bacterium]|nr:AtpZ/AtpI family protein [Gemmatimonadaceae bacterium]
MRDDTPRNPSPQKDGEINLGSFAGVGLQFAVAIVLFLFLGQWVDRKLGTSPVFLLAGVFIGGGAAFYGMYRRLTTAQKADDERRKREKESRG